MSSPAVLVVEDDSRIGELVRVALEDEQFAVTVVPGAIEAFAHLATEPVDVILFDLRLRGMDGRQFYAMIRERGVGAPAVVMSAWNDIERVAGAMGLPYLRKPFELDELVSAVRRAAGGEAAITDA